MSVGTLFIGLFVFTSSKPLNCLGKQTSQTEAHALHYFLERLGAYPMSRARCFVRKLSVFSLQRDVSDRMWCTIPPPKSKRGHQDDFFFGPRRTHIDPAGPEINDFNSLNRLTTSTIASLLPDSGRNLFIKSVSWSHHAILNKMFNSVLVFGSRKSIWDTVDDAQRYMILLIIDFGLQYVFPASYELLWSKSIDKTWISWMFFHMS